MFYIGDVQVSVNSGLVVFDDPGRESPLQIKVDDFPVLLDFLESFKLDRRRAFRVPVSYLANELTVLVEHGGLSYSAKAFDISAHGILLEFPDGSMPKLLLDERTQITLELGEHRAALTGIACRYDPPRYGISFDQSMQEETRASLRSIVRYAEEQWLARRIHGEKSPTTQTSLT